MSGSESEWDALIAERVRLLVASLSAAPGWEDVEQRLYTALPHLNPSHPTPSPLPPAPSSLPPLSSYIDHTLLRPDASTSDIHQLCSDAHQHHFYSVCVNPHHIPTALAALASLSHPHPSPVRVVAVHSFPLGQCSPAVKAYEAAHSRSLGAHELDTVINLSLLLSPPSHAALLSDLSTLITAALPLPTKVILETAPPPPPPHRRRLPPRRAGRCPLRQDQHGVPREWGCERGGGAADEEGGGVGGGGGGGEGEWGD